MILRDDVAYHRKFLLAGELIGGVGGPARALAFWVAAIGYARDHLTGGFIDDAFVSTFLLDFDGEKVANALGSRRVRLLHRVKGGYQIHDFDEHNGSAAKLRHQRELAKARKRRQREREAVENPTDSFPQPVEISPVTRDQLRDSRARETETETEKEKEYVQRADPYVPDQGRDRGTGNDRENSGSAARDTSETHTPRPPRTGTMAVDRRTREPAADGNYAVLERLAHFILEELAADDPESPEVVEALKVKAAALNINYCTDPQITRRALVSAATQRLLIPVVREDTGSVAAMADKLRKAATPAAMGHQLKTLAARAARGRR